MDARAEAAEQMLADRAMYDSRWLWTRYDEEVERADIEA